MVLRELKCSQQIPLYALNLPEYNTSYPFTSHHGPCITAAMADDDAFLPKLLTAGSDPLVRTWLVKNHDAFLAGLSGRLPDWERLAEAFATAGFRNKIGGAPNKEQLRKLWRIVRREVAAERAAKTVRAKPVSQAETSPPAVSTKPPSAETETERMLAQMGARVSKIPDRMK